MCEDMGIIPEELYYTLHMLVFLQFLGGALFLISGPFLPFTPPDLIAFLITAVVSRWAAIHMMTHSKFSVSPKPAERAQLLNSGPYRLIRNPMYASIILSIAVFTVTHFTVLRLIAFLFETTVLIYKITVEEKYLTAKFPGYKAYKAHTWRLIPYIF